MVQEEVTGAGGAARFTIKEARRAAAWTTSRRIKGWLRCYIQQRIFFLSLYRLFAGSRDLKYRSFQLRQVLTAASNSSSSILQVNKQAAVHLLGASVLVLFLQKEEEVSSNQPLIRTVVIWPVRGSDTR